MVVQGVDQKELAVLPGEVQDQSATLAPDEVGLGDHRSDVEVPGAVAGPVEPA